MTRNLPMLIGVALALTFPVWVRWMCVLIVEIAQFMGTVG